MAEKYCDGGRLEQLRARLAVRRALHLWLIGLKLEGELVRSGRCWRGWVRRLRTCGPFCAADLLEVVVVISSHFTLGFDALGVIYETGLDGGVVDILGAADGEAELQFEGGELGFGRWC